MNNLTFIWSLCVLLFITKNALETSRYEHSSEVKELLKRVLQAVEDIDVPTPHHCHRQNLPFLDDCAFNEEIHINKPHISPGPRWMSSPSDAPHMNSPSPRQSHDQLPCNYNPTILRSHWLSNSPVMSHEPYVFTQPIIYDSDKNSRLKNANNDATSCSSAHYQPEEPYHRRAFITEELYITEEPLDGYNPENTNPITHTLGGNDSPQRFSAMDPLARACYHHPPSTQRPTMDDKRHEYHEEENTKAIDVWRKCGRQDKSLSLGTVTDLNAFTKSVIQRLPQRKANFPATSSAPLNPNFEKRSLANENNIDCALIEIPPDLLADSFSSPASFKADSPHSSAPFKSSNQDIYPKNVPIKSQALSFQQNPEEQTYEYPRHKTSDQDVQTKEGRQSQTERKHATNEDILKIYESDRALDSQTEREKLQEKYNMEYKFYSMHPEYFSKEACFLW